MKAMKFLTASLLSVLLFASPAQAGTIISPPNILTELTITTGPLRLPSGMVFTWDSGDVTLTHSSNTLTLAGGVLLFPDGSTSAPSMAYSAEATTGFFRPGSGRIGMISAGTYTYDIASEFGMKSTVVLGWTSGAANAALDTLMLRAGAAQLQFGRNLASPVAYTLKSADATGGGPTAGANLTLQGGTGVGGGAYGLVALQTSGGNVIIGGSTAYSKLHVVGGNIAFESTYGLHRITGAGTRSVLDNPSAGIVRIRPLDNNATDGIRLEDWAGNSVLFVGQGGNLGTGTTVPRYKNTTIGVLSSLLSDDGTNYEGLTITPTTGAVTLAAVEGGTGSDNIDIVITPLGTGGIKWGKAVVALGGGAAPTVGTIGGSGPAAAAQNSWLPVKLSDGTAGFIPIWK